MRSPQSWESTFSATIAAVSSIPGIVSCLKGTTHAFPNTKEQRTWLLTSASFKYDIQPYPNWFASAKWWSWADFSSAKSFGLTHLSKQNPSRMGKSLTHNYHFSRRPSSRTNSSQPSFRRQDYCTVNFLINTNDQWIQSKHCLDTIDHGQGNLIIYLELWHFSKVHRSPKLTTGAPHLDHLRQSLLPPRARGLRKIIANQQTSTTIERRQTNEKSSCQCLLETEFTVLENGKDFSVNDVGNDMYSFSFKPNSFKLGTA